MPTFTYENSAASNSGVILLEVPDIAWFKDSVMSAIAEMCIPENWFGDDPDYEKYAVLQANLMQATYKVLNFNPFPVGMVVPFANRDAPPGYLICNGSGYTKTQYPELYAALDSVFIVDEENFNVPDMNDLAVVTYGGRFEFGESGGAYAKNITVDNMPSHTHEDAGHAHGIQLTTDGLAVAPGELPVVVPIPIIPGSTDYGYASIEYTGGGEPFVIQNPYIALNYCIYAGR